MKKFFAFGVCLVVLLCGLCFASSAMSIDEGLDALRTQFYHDDSSPLDYVAYSPVKSENDTKKYPLVVWLHGNSSGDYPGHQVNNSCIANWSSEEYQSRFEGVNGAFLLLPRCPTDNPVIAWGPERRIPLKKTIDGFISKNSDNVDTSRVYIGGYSMGGKMTIIMASSYPDFFAAAFPMSPVYEPTGSELKSMAQMPVWLFVNKNDKYVALDYERVVKPNWAYFSRNCAFPAESRLTSFDSFWHAEGVENAGDVHNTWDAVTYDMFMKSGEVYYASKTVNANGETVELVNPNGVISWLSAQSLEKRSSDSFVGFFRRLIFFVKRLFSLIFVI